MASLLACFKCTALQRWGLYLNIQKKSGVFYSSFPYFFIKLALFKKVFSLSDIL